MTDSNSSRPLKTADGSYTLHSSRYNQTYHSVHGARQESEHVFLQGSGVLDRLQRSSNQTPSGDTPIRILEVGLGLGLNALVTAEAALRYKTAVDYIGIEHEFLATEAIASVLTPFDPKVVQRLCCSIDQTLASDQATHLGTHSPSAPVISASVSLNPYFTLRILPLSLHAALSTDAISQVMKKDVMNNQGFEAIYLDAFSPDSNPECWNFDTLKNLAAMLVSGGNLATYCAKGSVRRDLVATGLKVTRRPGPPGKRECLVATA